MKLLVPVDESETAPRAVGHAAALSSAYQDVEALLLSVRHGPEFYGGLAPDPGCHPCVH